MPLGGLKWRDELEPKEFRRIKSEVQILGIDDAPFERKDKNVKIVAVLTRGAKMLDGVFHSSIKKDGLDATDRIIQLVKDIKRENVRTILLDGITYGGFNTVDIQRVYHETGIPVIVSMQKRPDHAKIHAALRNLENADLRKSMIDAAGRVYEIRLDGNRKVYMQTAGIRREDAEEIIRLTTVNGLVPEPIRAAHMIAKGAYTEIPKEQRNDEWLHMKAYNYVRDTHRKVKKWKRKTFPGFAGEVVSFLFALLLAWLFIQMLGWMLNTSSPLVVVESESMVHTGDWMTWYFDHNLDPMTYGFGSGMGVGDIIIVKGDNPDDINIGDVILYTKYSSRTIGGEPVIHRVVGIVGINGDEVYTEGAVRWDGERIITPCSSSSSYSLDEIRSLYSGDAINRVVPGVKDDLTSFRLFITKGDNPKNNPREDQCRFGGSPMISYPVHERTVVGRAKLDIPYIGYVKLGLVCAYRFATGNVCGCRCWWAADHPNCCR